jgi:single-strand DNA-binding protein
MASFNKVILIGNLTADPELRQTPSGISVCRFNIAINRRGAKPTGDQSQQTADFITIVAWRQTAEFVVRFFKKGKPILVCGQIQSRSWTDQQNQKHYATEVVADEVSFVENKGEGATTSAPFAPESYSAPSYSNTGAANGFEEAPNDDGLPF